MKNFLLGIIFVLVTVVLYASMKDDHFTVKELIEEQNEQDHSFLNSRHKSKDVLAELAGKSLRSSLGVDILPNGVIRQDFEFILTVLTADSDLGVYTIRLETFSPRFPPDSDIFVLGRVGEDYIGKGTVPGAGAQEILIKRVKNHLEVSLSDIYDLLFPVPVVAQQRAIFPLKSH